MRWKAIYKCRLCGDRYAKLVCTDPELVKQIMQDVTVDGVSYPDDSPCAFRLQDVHECFGGSLGVADFLGFDIQRDGE